MSSPTILITGGHLTPALAVMEQLHRHHFRLVFVGRHHAGDQTASQEPHQVANLATFVAFDAPKIHSKPFSKNLSELAKTPQSLSQANSILSHHLPDLILTFGGYLALPIALAAIPKRLPLITHEQTTVLGKTNTALSLISRKLALSWPETRLVPPLLRSKTVLTGNPVRSAFLEPQPQPSWFDNPDKLPLIYITGGNQGSHAINNYVFNNIASLSSHYHIVHQTGSINRHLDHRRSQTIRHRLSSRHRSHYYSSDWFNSAEASWLMHHADLVIGRSGANTVTELLLSQTRALLIPLPYSARSEQDHNARILSMIGQASLIPQDRISDLNLLIPKALSLPRLPRNPKVQSLIKLHSEAAKSLTQLIISCLDTPQNP